MCQAAHDETFEMRVHLCKVRVSEVSAVSVEGGVWCRKLNYCRRGRRGRVAERDEAFHHLLSPY